MQQDSPYSHSPRAKDLIPVSVCIVTNVVDDKLMEIISVCETVFSEIIVGLDSTVAENIALPTTLPGHANIYPVSWEGYSSTKNKVAGKAKNEWILSLDGDEVPDEQLLHVLGENFGRLDQSTIYGFRRVSFFDKQMIKYGAWASDKVWRLYNREEVHWQPAIVHERLGPISSATTASMVLLKGKLLHYTADDYERFLLKNKKYAALMATTYFERGKKSSLVKRYGSPAFTLLKEYVFRAGFLDGRAGWQIAKINALYTYWKYKFLHDQLSLQSTSN